MPAPVVASNCVTRRATKWNWSGFSKSSLTSTRSPMICGWAAAWGAVWADNVIGLTNAPRAERAATARRKSRTVIASLRLLEIPDPDVPIPNLRPVILQRHRQPVLMLLVRRPALVRRRPRQHHVVLYEH